LSAIAKGKTGEPSTSAPAAAVETHIQAEKVKDLKEAPVVSAATVVANAEHTSPPIAVQQQQPPPSQPVVAVIAAAIAPNEDAQKSTSPVPEVNHQQSSSYASRDKEKFVPKTIEDGNKRVSSKPKWARLDVEAKATSASHSSSNSTSAAPHSNTNSRRRSPPPPRRREDYREYRDERPIRRTGSNRGTVSSTSTGRGPRSGAASGSAGSTAPSNNNSSSNTSSNTTASLKPVRGSTSRRDNNTQYITRSTRPSYTESKTPGLNGNPVVKGSDVVYDAKKPKPSLIGRPIIIEPAALGTPIVTNVFGTYYFNGPTPFALDTIGNIKESIKKQM
jgi:hypothetical protein